MDTDSDNITQPGLTFTQQDKRVILYWALDRGVNDETALVDYCGLTLETVRFHMQNYSNGGTYHRKPGSGTNQKLSNQQIEQFLAYVDQHSELSSRQYAIWATQTFGFQVGRNCVIRLLKLNGFRHWKMRKEPNLTAIHRYMREIWCLQHYHFDWSSVFFTDETYFIIHRGKNGYWSIEQPVMATPLYSPKIGVWGGISSRTKTCLYFFEDSIDSEAYQEILSEVLIEEANFFYPDGYWLMQDNARPHVSWSTIHFLMENEISFIEWPSLSPDLNPIENVWALMKHEVEKQLPTSLDEVKLAIQKVWDDLDPTNYINSMQNRINECLDRNGACTSY